MIRGITGMVLALVLLLFALPTRAASSDGSWGLYNVSAGVAEVKQNPTNGHYYQLVEVKRAGMNWFEARGAAATMVYNGMPGYLATVTSQQEEDFIINNFPAIYPNYVWLGASDEANEGDWQWISGEAWDYKDWAIGEPNGGTSENCLEYGDYQEWWNDASCYYHETYFYLVEYSTSPTAVLIDIKPGSDRNPINCTNEKGVIAVAVLTTDDFDATTVDHTTVTFEKASETHVNKKKKEPRRHEEDVDKDRDIDLVFHFRFGETNLTCGSTKGTLIGETFDGQQIRGTDAVNPIPPYYYTTLLNDPKTSQSAVSIGLLSFGFFVGLALVLGSPAQLKRRRKR